MKLFEFGNQTTNWNIIVQAESKEEAEQKVVDYIKRKYTNYANAKPGEGSIEGHLNALDDTKHVWREVPTNDVLWFHKALD